MRVPLAIHSKFADSFVFGRGARDTASDSSSGPSALKLDSVLSRDTNDSAPQDAAPAPRALRANDDGPRAARAQQKDADEIVTDAAANAPAAVAMVDAPRDVISISTPAWELGAGIGAGAGAGIIGDPSVVRKYTSGSADGSDFNIEIVFRGNTWTSQLQQSFIDAADLLSDIIVGDVTDGRYFRPIDDIKIFANIADIDGAGGVLGQAGPIAYRTAELLPLNGIMEFDVADAASFDAIGMFNDIVFHEMMHVLGFGTLWDAQGLVTNGPNGELHFNGTNANIAYQADGGVGPIQIETDGGPGTAGGHWDEDLYQNEIMTGYIDVTGNFLSNTTIASLEDMGYDTVFDPNDPTNATAGLDMTIFNDHV